MNNEIKTTEITPSKYFKRQLVWRNVISLTMVHLSGAYGLYLSMFVAKPLTVVFMYFVATISAFGILCGAHRLWAHRSYKAKMPLQLLLAFGQTLSLQNDIYEWCRDHRVHHRYSDTDADPHNINRGFFFAHMGWLMCRKHPDVIEQGKLVDMSDLAANPVISLQRKFYVPLVALIWAAFPTLTPYYMWG
ncbi:unnamed protein product, partial [Medioppia subpectinata]